MEERIRRCEPREKNKMWDIVELPKGKKIVGSIGLVQLNTLPMG